MQKKRREITLSETIKRKADETRDIKWASMDNRCRFYTVVIMWFTVFGYIGGIGVTLLYVFS